MSHEQTSNTSYEKAESENLSSNANWRRGPKKKPSNQELYEAILNPNSNKRILEDEYDDIRQQTRSQDEENKSKSIVLSENHSTMSASSGVDSQKQKDLWEKAQKFVNSIQSSIEFPNQQEVKTNEQIAMDAETLTTLKQIRAQSISTGEEIDA